MTHQTDAHMKGRPMRGGLGRRLLMWFLLLSLIPLFGSNAIGYLRTQIIIEGLVERYLGGVADLQARGIEDGVERHFLYLEQMGSNNSVLLGTDPGSIQTYLSRRLDESAAFEAMAVVGLDGSVTSETREGLWGAPVGPEEPRRLSVEWSRDPADPPVLSLAVPIPNGTGRAAAYLFGKIPLHRAGALFDIPEHVAGSIESFVLDAAGRPLFVSHSHGPFSFAEPLVTPLLGLPLRSSARYRNGEGVDVLGTSVSIPEYAWFVVSEVPEDDALGGLWQLRSLSILVGLLFAGIVGGAAWLVAGGIVAPMGRLVAATRGVAAGDLSTRVEIQGRDEIGELGSAFNEMTAALEDSTERIQELHDQQIERASQLATVGELASGMAHEIKNPVAGLSNGLDLMVRRIGQHDWFDPIIDEMRQQVRRIDLVVRDLLTFARPSEPTFTHSDLNEVVERALPLVQSAADSGGVALTTDLEDGLPALWLDEELMGHVVVNLTVNAVQATPNGGRVTLATRAEGRFVELVVSDTGEGIPQERMEQIFKPFFTSKHRGTGLGLSITRNIVKRHGGDIHAESDLGHGSVFTMRVPTSSPPAAGRVDTAPEPGQTPEGSQ